MEINVTGRHGKKGNAAMMLRFPARLKIAA